MINVIADRYAQALFEVGEETQTTSELYKELNELLEIFSENKDFYSFLKSPLISSDDKKQVIQNIFKDQLSDSMNNFLKIVMDKDRMIWDYQNDVHRLNSIIEDLTSNDDDDNQSY